MAGSVGDPDIETGADTLLSFLEEKTKWPASNIAKDLGVPEDTVKEWAKALEKSGLVEIKYSAIKGMVLEYSSDKSYEELNEGRSQMSLQGDEIEIEAKEIEEVEEVREEPEGHISKTFHKEEEKEQEEKEQEEKEQEEKEQEEKEQEEKKENKDINDQKDESQAKEEKTRSLDSPNKIKRKGFNEATIKGEKKNKQDIEEKEEEKKEPENPDEDKQENSNEKIGEKQGKEKLKDKLEKLEKQKSSKKKKQKVQADKAKIKKKKKKVEKKTGKKTEGKKRDDKEKADKHRKDLEKVHDEVKSRSNGHEIEHEAGEDLGDHLENLRELGDLLRDKQVENEDVYSRMEIEIGALKNTLKEAKIDNEVQRSVSKTMKKVKEDMENEAKPPSILGKIMDVLTI